MDFKTKKISDRHASHHQSKPLNPKQKAQIITIVGGISLLLVLLFGIFSLIRSLDFSGIIFSFGKSLKTDTTGRTNILLAGVGGEGHDGGNLTDTIIVAGIDNNGKTASMLSIPRDLYVKTEKMKSGERINQIYAEVKNASTSMEGMNRLAEIAAGIAGVPIDYYIKVDFSGFIKIVDDIGGVDVNVEKDIYDPYYPLGETTRYQTFSIKAGPQHLDGETALKYARSRKGINSGGDFGRAHRQQELLAAIKDKALSLNILTDPGKIQEIYRTVSGSIETNLSINEIIELAKISKDFKKENVVSGVLSVDTPQCGGFLYFPAREYFGDASVELPAGKNYDSVHEFTSLLFQNPLLIKEQPPIQILNGTKTPNVAGEVSDYFSRLCLNVVYFGNDANRATDLSTLYYQPGPKGEKPDVLNVIAGYLPFKQVAGIPTEYLDSAKKNGTQVVIVLGSDYLQHRLQDPFNILPYSIAPTAPATTEQTTQQKKNL